MRTIIITIHLQEKHFLDMLEKIQVFPFKNKGIVLDWNPNKKGQIKIKVTNKEFQDPDHPIYEEVEKTVMQFPKTIMTYHIKSSFSPLTTT